MLHRQSGGLSPKFPTKPEDESEVIVVSNNSTSQKQYKILSALFYCFASFAVIFVNKYILSYFNFPHFNFLATSQFIVTSVVLSVLTYFKQIEIPVLTTQIFYEVFPITLMFLGNVMCGLGSTKALNLPMMTALRRFSILLTMLGEWFVLGNKPSTMVALSVCFMILGTVIAASNDITFNAYGYTLVFMNNIFTALNGSYHFIQLYLCIEVIRIDIN